MLPLGTKQHLHLPHTRHAAAVCGLQSHLVVQQQYDQCVVAWSSPIATTDTAVQMVINNTHHHAMSAAEPSMPPAGSSITLSDKNELNSLALNAAAVAWHGLWAPHDVRPLLRA